MGLSPVTLIAEILFVLLGWMPCLGVYLCLVWLDYLIKVKSRFSVCFSVWARFTLFVRRKRREKPADYHKETQHNDILHNWDRPSIIIFLLICDSAFEINCSFSLTHLLRSLQIYTIPPVKQEPDFFSLSRINRHTSFTGLVLFHLI